MINILDPDQLKYQPMTFSQNWRIEQQRGRTDNNRKRYAVFIGDRLHLVKDDKNLNRLFLERLKAENTFKALVYPIE